LGTQNGTSSPQTANGPVKVASSATEIRSGCCNSGYPVTGNYSESKSLLEPEHRNTSGTTSDLSYHQESHIYTPSCSHCFYAARLHLICLAVLVRIMLIVDYGCVFREVRYAYVMFQIRIECNQFRHEIGKLHIYQICHVLRLVLIRCRFWVRLDISVG
jgi:hypothetical protein